MYYLSGEAINIGHDYIMDKGVVAFLYSTKLSLKVHTQSAREAFSFNIFSSDCAIIDNSYLDEIGDNKNGDLR